MTDKQIYLNHIKRLEVEKRILLTIVLDERKMRIAAWQYYRKRLRSRLWMMRDFLMMAVGKNKF